MFPTTPSTREVMASFSSGGGCARTKEDETELVSNTRAKANPMVFFMLSFPELIFHIFSS
jgi:hypothetical protein